MGRTVALRQFRDSTQIRDWQQGGTRLLDANRAYLLLIDRHPDIVRKALAEMRWANGQSPIKLANDVSNSIVLSFGRVILTNIRP